MNITNRKQLFDFIDESTKAYEGVRPSLASAMGTAMSYFEGSQWIERKLVGMTETTLGRRPVSFNPDLNRLRVQSNRVTRFTIKSAAATFPKNLYVDALPAEGDGGVESMLAAQFMETVANQTVDWTGYLQVRRRANLRRCIAGTWGIGFQRKATTTIVDGVAYPTSRLEAFEFCPIRLTLDPGEQSTRLQDHETVMYSDVWTADKIERVLGKKLDRDKLKTVGQLSPLEQELYNLSGGRIFSFHRQYSNTKGALVHQLHCKDQSGRHGRYYVVIEVPEKEERIWVNSDNPVSPFACDGLPLALLHGHLRADSMWSIGDPAMMKDDQDLRNLMLTVFQRMAQKHGGWQWLVDKRAFPTVTDTGQLQNKFNNMVGGIVPWDSGRRDQNVQAPQLVSYPAPQPVFAEAARQSEEDMREQVFRAEGNMGQVKTHTPMGSFRAAIEEADQVLGIRITEDIAVDERMIALGAETMIRDAAAQDPETLRLFTLAGFGEDDLYQALRISEMQDKPTVFLSESSVRYRSYQQRRSDLAEGVNAQAISPAEYRQFMADDLDSPLATSDRTVLREIRKSVAMLLRTGRWEPLPLGQFNPWCIAELQRAIFDKAAKRDPAIRQAVIAAIQAQQMVVAQDTAMMAAAESPPTPTTDSGTSGLTPQDVVGSLRGPPETLGDLMDQLAAAPGAAGAAA